jgi:hypothetical protein
MTVSRTLSWLTGMRRKCSSYASMLVFHFFPLETAQARDVRFTLVCPAMQGGFGGAELCGDFVEA